MTDVQMPASVLGQTALYTAWVRHTEAEHPDPLFTDPLAGHLVGELADDPAFAELLERMRVSVRDFPVYHAVRTRYFDDRIRHALDSGVRQLVTLAAGADGRPVRLPCPPGTRWFELDLPDMTAFKTALVERSGLPLACERVGVAADLTADWATPLREAGFRPSEPTAWLIEGVIMYLTPEEGDELLAELTALSAPGSHLLLEHLQEAMFAGQGAPTVAGLAKQGVTFRAARDDVEDWLGGFGWRAKAHAGGDPEIGHGRTFGPVPAAWLAAGELTGELTGEFTSELTGEASA